MHYNPTDLGMLLEPGVELIPGVKGPNQHESVIR
jgi:hypothetical protein